jgi:hypothetical protein
MLDSCTVTPASARLLGRRTFFALMAIAPESVVTLDHLDGFQIIKRLG